MNVSLSSPSSITPTCTLENIVSPQYSYYLSEIACSNGIRNLQDTFRGIPFIITCSISSSLSDATITVSEVKGKVEIEENKYEVKSFDLSNIEQINNTITCLIEDRSESNKFIQLSSYLFMFILFVF